MKKENALARNRTRDRFRNQAARQKKNNPPSSERFRNYIFLKISIEY